jgi:acetyltransferase
LAIRPIRPEDEPLLKRFHESLSDETVYSRYAQLVSLGKRTMHERLSRLCFIDYDRQMALIAIDENSDPPQMVAVARLIKLHAAGAAEFAIVIADAFHRLGLGMQLMERLVEVGRAEKLDQILGYVSLENTALLALCRRLRFQVKQNVGDTRCVVVREL